MVEDMLTKEWNTLRNTHVNRPCALLRSIIIDALSKVTSSWPEAAGAVWNTATNRLRHGQVSLGNATDVVIRLLTTASEHAEAEAISRAGLVAPTYKNTRAKNPR